MSDKKISQLAASTPQLTDEIPAARGGNNVKLTVGDLAGLAAIGTTYLASFGDSTPAIIFVVPAGQALDNIDVEITEVWDGPGAFISIGTPGDPAKFFGTNETELTDLAVFSKTFSDLGLPQVQITISPGPSPTTGKVRIQITTTKAGT